MSTNKHRPWASTFLVLEGIDGCGKSYHAQRLAGILRQQGYNVLHTREPGGTYLGERVREMVLSTPDIDPVANAFLFHAARYQHRVQVVQPALDRGDVVICERWSPSTYAYQGAMLTDELQKHQFETLALHEMSWALPAYARRTALLLLDVPVTAARERMRMRGTSDVFEVRGPQFYERCRERYLHLWRTQADCVVDASGTLSQTCHNLQHTLEALELPL